jgi:hypothetical protein
MTDPRTQTVAEFMALPITGFGAMRRNYTEDEISNGYVMIGPKRIPITPGTKSVIIPTSPTGFVLSPDFDATFVRHTDEMGVTWGLALHESGKWFRKQA